MSAVRHGAERSEDTGRAAGLVPYKTTSLHDAVINLAPHAVAERRVKRLKRSVWASGHLHGIADLVGSPPVCWFVTLTYVGVDDWNPGHIRAAVDRFRKWCKSKGVACRYTWVAELQRRGAVHYHLLAWLPHGLRMPHWDRAPSAARSAFWQHGMSNTEVAKSGVGYLMKYLSKLGELSTFPKGLRLYGIGGLNANGRAVRAWFNLPQWAKSAHGVGDLVRRPSSLDETGLRFPAGLVVRQSGELLPPVFSVQRVPGGISLRKLRDVPSRFVAHLLGVGEYPGAYSSWPRTESLSH